MISYPAVVVHGLAHVRAALKPGRPLRFVSAPGAALFAGAAWWLALIEEARACGADTPFDDLLDCADAAGRAMEALRLGQRAIVLAATCTAFAAVRGAAATLGAIVATERPVALDMARRGAERDLAAWLAGR